MSEPSPLAVRELTVRRRLAGVGFTLRPGEFAALVGVSGAGKSTLLRVLAGLLPPSGGDGVIAGAPLGLAAGGGRIGYVPQSDALRGELSVHQELTFAAELRCPDLGRDERDGRIDRTLARLGLGGLGDRTISTLSAGERKRVSVAVEMLAAPEVLLLDEATSGIDPAHELTLLRYLKQLSREGCTILLATHSTLALAEFDRLIMLGPGGRLLFAGAPADALRAAGVAAYPQLFDRDEPFAALDPPVPDPAVSPERRDTPAEAPQRGHGRAEPRRTAVLPVLVAREFTRLVTDRRMLAFVALQAPVLGLLVRAMLGDAGLGIGSVASNLQARRALLTLTLAAVWLGSANAIREIVKDRPVLERDRVAGVGPGRQLVAKVAMLALVSAVQAILLVAVGLAGVRPPPGPPVGGHWAVALVLALWLCAVASGCIALAISALVRRSDYALALLPVVLVPQLVLSGGVMPLEQSQVLSAIGDVSAARWGFSLVASSAHLRAVETRTVLPVPLSPADLNLAHHEDADATWDPTPGAWWADVGGLVLVGLAGAAIAALGLRRRLA